MTASTSAPTAAQRLLRVGLVYAEPEARDSPRGQEILARFPGAEIVDVRASGGEPPAPLTVDAPMMTDDPPFDEDD